MAPLLDPSIVRYAQDGDPVAFDVVVKHVRPNIEQQLKRYPLSDEDRRDLLQSVLMRLLSKIGSFRGDASFSTWLFRVTANEALMLMRSNRRHTDRMAEVRDVEGLEAPAPDNDPTDGMAERCGRVREALNQIPEPYKNVVVAHYLLDLDLRQIAKRFDISESAVRSRLFRARARLRANIGSANVSQPAE
jgi:RNA polymerase sigma-70 factor (ECF subfamily)